MKKIKYVCPFCGYREKSDFPIMHIHVREDKEYNDHRPKITYANMIPESEKSCQTG